MKQFLFLLLIISQISTCHAQETESRLIEERLIDWQDYPRFFEDAEKTTFLDTYKPIANVDVYELFYESDGHKIQAFAAVPKAEGTYPVIIFNRGGNRDLGALQVLPKKGSYSVAYNFPRLAQEGFVVIGCNYRGGGKSEGQDEFGGADVNDVLNLIEVVEEIPKADANNIGMYGFSRGGMMTYLTLPKTDRIKAAVIVGGPTDKTIIDRPNMETMVYSELIPDYWNQKEEELKKRSAVYFADRLPRDVPILLLHGNIDWRVKSTHALNMALEFEKYRIPYRLKIFEGAGHTIREFQVEKEQEIVSWFNRFLKQNEAIPNMQLKDSK